jgi:hypothetical protein
MSSDEGFPQVTYWACKNPRVKKGVVLPAVPHKPEPRKFPDCYGCWGGPEPHPSQRYHMQKGGCLYDAAFDPWGKIKEQP